MVRRSNGEAAVADPATDEISAPVRTAEEPPMSFGRRLRLAIEALNEGEKITIRTRNERQQVTNVVGTVQKRLQRRYTTHQEVKRSDDPEGKIVLTIRRLALDD